MRKSILFILGTMLLFTACNREITHPYRSVDEAISFDTYAGGVTRTAALSTGSLTDFGAAAYTGAVQVMDNQLVSGGNGSWTYSPIKYWPQSGPLYFSAYAPYATASNGITPAYNTTTRTIDLSYALPAAEADQVDLLMAANVNVADCSADRPAAVQFTFGHILSRIGLTARYTGTVSSGTTVTLTDVKISGNFVESGDYTVSGGWDNRAASATDLVYDRPAAKLAATAMTTSAQALLAGDNYVMVIPNGDEASVTGTITVYYTVTTSDGVSVDYVKDASSPLAYEPNKTYTYNLIIDVDSDAITFGDVTVSDWESEVSMDVDVHSYSNSLSVTGLSFTPIRRTVQYTVNSIRTFANGSAMQIPWYAEFSLDGGSTYSTTVPSFFDEFTASDTASGTYTATTSVEINVPIYIKFIQNITNESKEEIVDASVKPQPLTFEILSDGEIKWTASNTLIAKTISYKLNDGEWIEITSDVSDSAPSIAVESGDIIQFKGYNQTYGNSSGAGQYNYFGGSASFNIKGNIMSLIAGDDYAEQISFPSGSTLNFRGLFKNNKNIYAADLLELPAINLSLGCYSEMFYGCSNIVSPPLLPATTLAQSCYEKMFFNCTNLISAPDLPATSAPRSCYSQMFSSCKRLTTAPNLPATTLGQECYFAMFSHTGLKATPELPAVNLIDSCYEKMFQGCSDLLSACILPASRCKYKCYADMFSGCINLITTPDLPATTLAQSCYERMFLSCTSITTPPELPATTLQPYCYKEMFSHCSNLTLSPELPAATTSPYCYYAMFERCTSLTSAPELIASELSQNCYMRMFYNCVMLNNIICLATNISASHCLQNWTDGVSATGTFIKSPSMTSWPSGTSGIPSGWTVQDTE